MAPSHHRPEVPAALDRVVLDLLAKSPDGRPASAAEARRALVAAAAANGDRAEPGEESSNPLEALARGVFVGRDAELEEMRGLLEDALAGQGRLLLLSGDPGIGKTRTAEQLSTYARVRGARVYWGRCHEGEGQPPYWPWAEALRGYVLDADPVGLRWQLGSRAADVAQIVPELARAPRRRRRAARHGHRAGALSDLRLVRRLPRRRLAARARSCSSSTTCTGPTSRRCCCCASSPAGSPTPDCS